MSKKQEQLTDLQLALIVKTALDHNARIITFASFIYGQTAKPNIRKSWAKELDRKIKFYNKRIEEIINYSENEAKLQ